MTCVSRNASDHVVLSGAQDGNLLLHVVGTGQAVNLTKEETSKQVDNTVYNLVNNIHDMYLYYKITVSVCLSVTKGCD